MLALVFKHTPVTHTFIKESQTYALPPAEALCSSASNWAILWSFA
eukprot:COSAG01_NODE_21467_length_900_cov_95.772784_1_plen_44_part_10